MCNLFFDFSDKINGEISVSKTTAPCVRTIRPHKIWPHMQRQKIAVKTLLKQINGTCRRNRRLLVGH